MAGLSAPISLLSHAESSSSGARSRSSPSTTSFLRSFAPPSSSSSPCERRQRRERKKAMASKNVSCKLGRQVWGGCRLSRGESLTTAVCAFGGNDDFDPFAEADESSSAKSDLNSFKDSKMVNSPIIAEEAQKIFAQFKELSALQPKYNKVRHISDSSHEWIMSVQERVKCARRSQTRKNKELTGLFLSFFRQV